MRKSVKKDTKKRYCSSMTNATVNLPGRAKFLKRRVQNIQNNNIELNLSDHSNYNGESSDDDLTADTATSTYLAPSGLV